MNMPTCTLCHLRVRVPCESVLLPSPHLRSQSHPPVVNPKLILIGRVVLWDSFLRQSFFNWHFYIFGRHWQSFEDDVCPRIEFGDPPSPSDDGLEFPSQLLSSSLQLNMLFEDRWPQTNSPPEMESCSRVLEVKTLQGANQEQTFMPELHQSIIPRGKSYDFLANERIFFGDNLPLK